MQTTIEERFWSKVKKTNNPSACWNWAAAIDTPGYGAFGYEGKKQNAHRIAYRLTSGPIPKGMDVRHTCDNRLCCNPNHLLVGTRKENMQDCITRNRHAKGEKIGNATMTDKQVIAIKRLIHEFGASAYLVAQAMDVDRRKIQDIKRGKTWSHIQLEEAK